MSKVIYYTFYELLNDTVLSYENSSTSMWEVFYNELSDNKMDNDDMLYIFQIFLLLDLSSSSEFFSDKNFYLWQGFYSSLASITSIIDIGDYTIYDLFFAIIFRFYKNPIARFVLRYPGEEITNEVKFEAFQEFLIRLLNKAVETVNYYLNLMTIYENEKNNLLNQVQTSSSSTNKYNDTPQNNNSSGTFEGDNYLTNYSKYESQTSTDFDTIMGRIEEIQQKYRNIFSDWVNEFRSIFYEEV